MCNWFELCLGYMRIEVLVLEVVDGVFSVMYDDGV